MLTGRRVVEDPIFGKVFTDGLRTYMLQDDLDAFMARLATLLVLCRSGGRYASSARTRCARHPFRITRHLACYDYFLLWQGGSFLGPLLYSCLCPSSRRSKARDGYREEPSTPSIILDGGPRQTRTDCPRDTRLQLAEFPPRVPSASCRAWRYLESRISDLDALGH